MGPNEMLKALVAKLAMIPKNRKPEEDVELIEETPPPDMDEIDLAPPEDMAALDIRTNRVKAGDIATDADIELDKSLSNAGYEQRGINTPGGKGRLIAEKGWSPSAPKGVTPLSSVMYKMLVEDNPNAGAMAEFLKQQQAEHPMPGTQKVGDSGSVGVFATNSAAKNDVFKRLAERYLRKMASSNSLLGASDE